MLYEDQDGRRFIDVEGEHEPEFATTGTGEPEPVDHTKIIGRRARIADLLDYRLLQPVEALTWQRPRVGQSRLRRLEGLARGPPRDAAGRRAATTRSAGAARHDGDADAS